MAATMGNAAVCGIYPTDKAENVQYKARHTACNIAVVESGKQVVAFKEAVALNHYDKYGGIPTLKAIDPEKASAKDPTMRTTFTVGRQHVRVLSWQTLVTEESKR
eukprot:gene39914-48501_t